MATAQREQVTDALLVAALLIAFWFVGVAATWQKCTTFDEIAHITSGVSYWQNVDFRLQPENGNLPQRWCALPLVLGGMDKLPGNDNPAWHQSDVWTLGPEYFYRTGHSADQILRWSRSVAMVWGVLTAGLVYLWSRDLFGRVGGLLSLVVCVTDPTMLANGPLATSDMCATFFFTASVFTLWKLLHRATIAWWFAAALSVSGLFLAKTSAPLIIIMATLLIAVRSVAGPNWELRRQGAMQRLSVRAAFGLLAVAALGIASTTILLVWISYAGRYAGISTETLPDGVYYYYETLAGVLKDVSGFKRVVLQRFADLRLLPEAFLFGTAYVFANLTRDSFLCGEYSETGWWYYFPYTFLVKTPLVTLVAVGLAFTLQLRTSFVDRSRGAWSRWYDWTPLLVSLTVYWLVAIGATLNIGHRHLLPTYPLLFIVIGSVWSSLAASRWRRSAVVLIVLAAGANAAFAFPHYLAYFNGIVTRGSAYRYLVDSNLDWGQDLPGLKQWLDNRHANGELTEPVFLGYFGNGDPAYYGIDARLLLNTDTQLDAGWYCISATTLQGIYVRGGGRWTPKHETWYQQAQTAISRSLALTPEKRRQQVGYTDERFLNDMNVARQATLLRLLAGLRDEEPVDNIGGSILIFRLTEDDLKRLLLGPPPRSMGY